MDQIVQHKVEEGRIAYKRAQRKRRNEDSSLIIELEYRLRSEFFKWIPANQKSGYTKME